MSGVLAKVFCDGERAELYPWHEWRNVSPADLLHFPMMVLRKWVRDRGGLLPGEQLSVTVYHCPANVERHASGEPVACIGTTFNVSKDN